jgi:O-methyltransferase
MDLWCQNQELSMYKAGIKKIFQLGGMEINRSDSRRKVYQALYKKYKDYTMIPEEFFTLNLDLCDHFKNLNGDYVECGVWRGGMSAAIAEVLGLNKRIHLFDSFQGLPPAKDIDGKEAMQWQQNTKSSNYYNNCAAEESYARKAMEMSKQNQYKIYSGWFQETLLNFPQNQIGILRLDGDWYDSILICLKHLFPKVINGGVIILDDYYTWDGCARAVHDYLSEMKSPSRIYQWKNQVGFIIKKNE